ncbi:hypothetical protein HC928_13525 [bacterium]|nr:hypothetical protein [bacterium]
MAIVLFYEKPGCINNTKQKKMLAAAGHQVDARSLLTESWTSQRLRSFFGDRPVSDWFNPSAPEVKSGAVVPEQLDAETALALMIQNPLLIRRPLMQVGDRCEVGFDQEKINTWIGLQASAAEMHQDLQSCPRTHI